MSGSNKVRLGSITGTHGVKGAVRLRTELYIKELLEPEALFVKDKGAFTPWFCEWIDEGRENELLIKFEELESPEEAATLRGCEVWVTSDQVIVEEEENEFEQWIGMQVENEDGLVIGSIIDIIDRPQQPVAIVTSEAGEFMLPLAEELIIELNMLQSRIRIRIPEGLMDL